MENFDKDVLEDSEEDIVTDYSQNNIITNSNCTDTTDFMYRTMPSSTLVPTISVTPHSSAGRNYLVLEDNIQQLHDIHEAIQQMRDSATLGLSHMINFCGFNGVLSSSCPSLSKPKCQPDDSFNLNSSPTHADLSSVFDTKCKCKLSSNNKRKSIDWYNMVSNCVDTKENEIIRRRSWAALDDLTKNHCLQILKQDKSASLSSMDSEAEDPFVDSTINLLKSKNYDQKSRKNVGFISRRFSGNSSSHSLNESDYQNEFNKIIAKRVGETYLLQARSPLQKSISTPSIMGIHDIINKENVLNNDVNKIPTNYKTPNHQRCRPSGTEDSETEEETLDVDSSMKRCYVTPSTNSTNMPLYNLFSDTSEDQNAKRRKRGSLFFRKKKDKSKKVLHSWISPPYSNFDQSCGWCAKPLENKPALSCESCLVTVHQNSCKDQVSECVKQKYGKSNLRFSSASFQQRFYGKRQSSINQFTSPNSHSEEKDDIHYNQDGVTFSDEVSLVQFEFLNESHITAHDLNADPALGLHEEQPDSWTPTVTKEVVKKLKDKEIKRQEHIYEFVLTEKHHCLTLKVMQKVFADGLQKHFQLGDKVYRMFPRLAELTEIHLGFLKNLKEKQRKAALENGGVVDSIADLLLDQFSSINAQRLKSAYGEFCSRHRDALDVYKMLEKDPGFFNFIKHCQANPLLKKKGIPECVLFVTQRLTKYPLLIEPLIKTSKENKVECEKLSRALALVKDILVEVDSQVAEKEKEDRKLEIYNRLEAKSFTNFRGRKFKKSDLLSENRRLRFEGTAWLMQRHSKMQMVMVNVIVMTDVLFFILENNHKYTFFMPESNKEKETKVMKPVAGVVSLQKLLVREKAGTDTKGIYLISSNPAEPEMFELKVHKPKDKQVWINSIRSAVQECPEEEDDGYVTLSFEERQRQLETKKNNIREIVEVLKQKDLEQALIFEEIMGLKLKLLASAGVDNLPIETPSYSHLVTEHQDTEKIRKEVMNALQKVNQLTSSLYASGTHLSRSASSVGEHHSVTYVSPTLPKRAETFGGFDNSVSSPKNVLRKLSKVIDGNENGVESSNSSPIGTPSSTRKENKMKDSNLFWKENCSTSSSHSVTTIQSSGEIPTILALGNEQQAIVMELTHYICTLSTITLQQLTNVDSLQAELALYKSQHILEETTLSNSNVGSNNWSSKDKKPVYRHNQQLEELRNLQDKLTQEKEIWIRERDLELKELEEKREQLQRLQELVRSEQTDVTQQREQLYLKLQTLTNQGIIVSPNMQPPPVSPNQQTSNQSSTDGTGHPLSHSESVRSKKRSDSVKWKQHTPPSSTSSSTLPINLISATNQQKVASKVQIKQKLPFKLANKLSNNPNNSLSEHTVSSAPNVTSSTQSSYSIQQLLPLKLRESAKNPANLIQGNSTEILSPSPQGPSHSRTGSSPAMMQTAQIIEGKQSGNKAGRTNTYPKLPDKFRIRSPDSKHSKTLPPSNSTNNTTNTSTEEEVLYF
ncbi:rho guanine nucleotide exchange factor 18 isoform X2 [Daktulosphaira vitifoliae]|uniref:rho guanine nucleotide exchange factor 18 isoform X2 n=1 Tax=Daktulosphaira vitifoliae TaxID=58002 RepID=UPI0021AAFC61|nr:rho guanine nucleotide exchange factor 18 isoform X2 [Daktulosphaira vitifoliae]